MQSINPVCKFIGIFVPAILLAFFYRPLLNLLVFCVCVVILLFSRANKKTMGIFLLLAGILALGLFVTGYQFPSGATLGNPSLVFTDAAVINGLQLSSRVLAFAGLGMLFVLTTNRLSFIQALEQQVKLPPKFAYGILAAWGMLPNMKEEYKKTRAAFWARGLHPGAISPALLTPLLVKSVRWSEALACAMESKGFGDSKHRTHYRSFHAGKKDILFCVFSCALVALGLLFIY